MGMSCCMHSFIHIDCAMRRHDCTGYKNKYVHACVYMWIYWGLVRKKCNSSALAIELHLSCTNPSIYLHIYGSVQDCSNFSVLAVELLQPCTKPSICTCMCVWAYISVYRWLVQDCSNSSTLAMDLLQSCTKTLICICVYLYVCMCLCILVPLHCWTVIFFLFDWINWIEINVGMYIQHPFNFKTDALSRISVIKPRDN